MFMGPKTLAEPQKLTAVASTYITHSRLFHVLSEGGSSVLHLETQLSVISPSTSRSLVSIES
jgi:hypothetical protein